jgi:hypothetical protein
MIREGRQKATVGFRLTEQRNRSESTPNRSESTAPKSISTSTELRSKPWKIKQLLAEADGGRARVIYFIQTHLGSIDGIGDEGVEDNIGDDDDG